MGGIDRKGRQDRQNRFLEIVFQKLLIFPGKCLVIEQMDCFGSQCGPEGVLDQII